jgi:hypothetical protein
LLEKDFIPQFINSNANCAVCKGTIAYSSSVLNLLQLDAANIIKAPMIRLSDSAESL